MNLFESQRSTKVICVHTGRVPVLTLHKIYDGVIYDNGYVQITDDSGESKLYKGERFMRLDEFRENKLKELGI